MYQTHPLRLRSVSFCFHPAKVSRSISMLCFHSLKLWLARFQMLQIWFVKLNKVRNLFVWITVSSTKDCTALHKLPYFITLLWYLRISWNHFAKMYFRYFRWVRTLSTLLHGKCNNRPKNLILTPEFYSDNQKVLQSLMKDPISGPFWWSQRE